MRIRTAVVMLVSTSILAIACGTAERAAVPPLSSPSASPDVAETPSLATSQPSLAPTPVAPTRIGRDEATYHAASRDPALEGFAIELSEPQSLDGGGARLKMRVCNGRSEAATVRYNYAQRYDFEIRSKSPTTGAFYGSDRKQWIWSSGRAFELTPATEQWRPAECRDFAEEWSGKFEDGTVAIADEFVVSAIFVAFDEGLGSAMSFCYRMSGCGGRMVE